MGGDENKTKEDHRLILGKGRYLDDAKPEGLLYAGFSRSPFGHARINSISVPTESPNVVACVTGKDIDNTLPMILRWPDTPLPPYYLLAKEEALYAGQPVVAIACISRSILDDSLDAIQVDYEQLPSVIDPERALESDSPLVHTELDSNLIGNWSTHFGDFESASAEADVVIEEKFSSQRVTGHAIEPRATLAHFDQGTGILTVRLTTQCPHMDKTLLADSLKMPENKIRVIADDVGGGFGINSHLHVESILTCLLSIKIGRPVEWVEDRREHIQGAIHSGDFIQYITLAAKKDGTILGIKNRIIQDAGAYLHSRHIVSELVIAHLVIGPYRIRNYSVELSAAFTNKGPVGTYRAFGMTNASFVREVMMDIIAKKLDLDPAAIRIKNFIQPNEFPYGTGTGLVYDSGDYERAFRKALSIFNYESQRKLARENNDSPLGSNSRKLGIGIGAFIEEGAVDSLLPLTSGNRYKSQEPALIRLNESGEVGVYCATGPSGQGHETTLAQIVASELGVSYEKVRVIHGDTSICPYGPNGTVASRSINMAGNAALIAAKRLAQRLAEIASQNLGVDTQDIDFRNGIFYSKANGSKSISITDLAKTSAKSGILLEELAVYEPDVKTGTASFGVEIALVEVDIETGLVKIRKMVMVHDCGRMINPKIVESISHGGMAQGVGAALFEEIEYGEDGDLVGTTLADYLIPTSLDLPDLEVDHTETLSPTNPLGVKGGGESGIIGAPAAVANAIYDALGQVDLRFSRIPIKPEIITLKLKP